MKKVIIIRYSEIFLKGKNRGYFERALETNIRRALKGFECTLEKQRVFSGWQQKRKSEI